MDDGRAECRAGLIRISLCALATLIQNVARLSEDIVSICPLTDNSKNTSDTRPAQACGVALGQQESRAIAGVSVI
jgi:hypothetical protein